MKKIVTFRVDEDVIILLQNLAKEYDTSKVHILENAIRNYANIKKFKKKDLLKFAGKLDKKDYNLFKEIK